MHHTHQLLLSFCTTMLLFTQPTSANPNNNLYESKDWVILPYIFSSTSTGFAGGIGFIKQGIFQPQTTFVTSIFTGGILPSIENGLSDKERFRGAFFSFSDYKLPFSQRFFFSFIALKSYFPQQKYYVEGSNSSSQDKVLTTAGKSDFFNTTFEYVLPIGEGLDNPEGVYRLKDGFALGRDGYGNGVPFISGRTTLGLKTFYQEDSFENWSDFTIWENGNTHTTPLWNTNGLRLFLNHDNTDFDLNPSRGYHFEVQYSKDFAKGDSLQSWDFLEFKINKYYTLNTFSFSKQNVLALSLWTGYSFSWDNNNEVASGISAHRTPPWEGARLGGFTRMRGYDNNRFSDKAAFYTSAEYRAILDYNPFKKNTLLPISIDWFQLVAFIEAGRVNAHYNVDLLKDLKYDVGLSLRTMVAKIPIRFDIAYGNEGTNLWVMIQHPFDF